MKQHQWERETVDGGSSGKGDFWKCRECGASGGPVGWSKKLQEPPAWPPFLSGLGLRQGALPEDCDEAKELIPVLRKLVGAEEEAAKARQEVVRARKRAKRKDSAVARLLHAVRKKLS